jgi:hypothetical protein
MIDGRYAALDQKTAKASSHHLQIYNQGAAAGNGHWR